MLLYMLRILRDNLLFTECAGPFKCANSWSNKALTVVMYLIGGRASKGSMKRFMTAGSLENFRSMNVSWPLIALN